MKFYSLLFCLVLKFSLIYATSAQAFDKGIYITQSTLANTQYLTQLINQSKEVGINTFVVDLKKDTRSYSKNIKLIKSNGIRYVARIVVFAKGGNINQVRSLNYWKKKYHLVDAAIKYGADEIQLDYIRYSTKQRPSSQNSVDIHNVIKWFKSQNNVPLQIDVFGEASFKPSTRIGQDVRLFAPSVDAVCPMVYPSHYKPYSYHSNRPYETINKSLKAMRLQFNNKPPFKIKPYIEATNFRYKMSTDTKIAYILEQIRAVEDNDSDGWYVWSANNKYGALFKALKLKNNGQTVQADFNFAPKSKSKSRPKKQKQHYKTNIDMEKWKAFKQRQRAR
tara:strand:+ start:74389 stop:75393 length:1005 start_codon:yes stop_codon:yes gene_type:complete